MKEDLQAFLEELSLLTIKYNIEITNDHVQVLLKQGKEGHVYEHEDLKFNLRTMKYEVNINNDPYEISDYTNE